MPIIKYLSLLVFLTVPLPVFAGEVHEIIPFPFLEWRNCDQDWECVVLESTCPDAWMAINQQYQAAYETQRNAIMPYVECKEFDPAAVKPETAYCVSNICEIH
jgi:hypothetical protein